MTDVSKLWGSLNLGEVSCEDCYLVWTRLRIAFSACTGFGRWRVEIEEQNTVLLLCELLYKMAIC